MGWGGVTQQGVCVWGRGQKEREGQAEKGKQGQQVHEQSYSQRGGLTCGTHPHRMLYWPLTYRHLKRERDK